MVSEIPKTRICVSHQEAERLRDVVRRAEFMNGRIAGARIAQPEDAEALANLLGHESIGPRIYTLPDPINAGTMQAFIADHLELRARGEGVLFAAFNAAGEATAYFDVELWPHWSAAKFGGAVKPERQGRGFGGACGLAAVEWLFEHLGVNRICQTTATDNDRSIRLNARLGMTQMGEVMAERLNGARRRSLYWEIERTAWEGARMLKRTG